MIEVELPDGTIAEFPDGTGRDVIKRALAKRVPKERETTAIEAIARGFGQGATLTAADEIASGIQAGYDYTQGKPFGQSYEQRLKSNRSQDALNRKQRPLTYGGAALTGGVVQGGLAAAAAPASAILNPATAGQLAKSGAAYGGVTGFLSGQGGVESRAIDGTIGAGLGAASGYATGKVLDRFLPNNAPSAEALKGRYVAAKDKLKSVPVDSATLQSDVIQPMMDVKRFRPNSFDKDVSAVVDDLAINARRGSSAYNIDEIRGRIPAGKDGAQLRDALDKYLEAQNVPSAFRDDYRRAMLATKVQQAVDRGESSPASMRTALASIAKGKGVKDFEREAILKASKTPLKVGNLPSAILGLSTGNPVGTGAAYVGGRMFDAAAEDASAQSARNALNAILMGRRLPGYAERLGALVGLTK